MFIKSLLLASCERLHAYVYNADISLFIDSCFHDTHYEGHDTNHGVMLCTALQSEAPTAMMAALDR